MFKKMFTISVGVCTIVAISTAIVLLSHKLSDPLGIFAELGGPYPPAVPACPVAKPIFVGTILVPAGPVAGYCQDQLANAATIISAAKSLGIGPRTQTVGVMTAMGESSLRNLDYGDAAGPDSRGLFQQRANGAWGTLTDRMTPYTAAHNFFSALVKVPDWQTMEPTQLAHAVQINQDPNHYARYWPAAGLVVAALSGSR